MKLPRIAPSYNGFSLVTTVAMLVLLTLVALGLLSLSTIAARSSSISSAQERANANARMALMMAIDRLQLEMGPDQRISANGSILSTSTVANPHWMGVWDSWRAGQANPLLDYDRHPDSPSNHSTILSGSGGDPSPASMHPTYDVNREDHFRSWLVSLNEEAASNLQAGLNLDLDATYMPSEDQNAVILAGKGSLGEGASATNYVKAPLVQVDTTSTGYGNTGRYGWWVGDESQKARIIGDSYNQSESLTDADRIHRMQAPGSMGNSSVTGLEDAIDTWQFDRLISLKSMDLVDVDPPNAPGEVPSQTNFHDITTYSTGVMADVREGGLKRDLSTLLERPIDTDENGDEFMLYKFFDEQQQVPIQDLAAYYQLYNNRPNQEDGGRGGVTYNSDSLPNAIQVLHPDYGTPADRNGHLREYSSLYRTPVPVRVQFLMALGAVPITAEEREYLEPNGLPPTDTHKVMMGIMPVVTMWNPNNLPLVIEQGNRQVFMVTVPAIAFRWRMYNPNGDPNDPNNSNPYTYRQKSGWLNFSYALSREGVSDGRALRANPFVARFKFAESDKVVFEPGEVKTFSFNLNAANSLIGGTAPSTALSNVLHEAVNAWDPYSFLTAFHSDVRQAPDSFGFYAGSPPGLRGSIFMFGKASDKFTIEIAAEGTPQEGKHNMGRRPSMMNEVVGSGLGFWSSDYDFIMNPDMFSTSTLHYRTRQFLSRFGGGAGVSQGQTVWNREFNHKMLSPGFPDIAGVQRGLIPFDDAVNAIPASEIIAASQRGEVTSVMMFSMMAGCETSTGATGGFTGGRRTATRPFLHGSSIRAPLIDQAHRAALYNHGWEFQVDRINTVEEAIQVEPLTGRSFWGAGYTPESGTTHVVQQHLPVLPPISIASLSHAHLGGFSLAKDPVCVTPDANEGWIGFGVINSGVRTPKRELDFQQVTATGAAGLAPNVMQAIGNSYAHPVIPAGDAHTIYDRRLDINQPDRDIVYADHSYLANKALWDEFFFSTITPQLGKVPLYERGSEDREAADVAREFLFEGELLPNRRMQPYAANLNSEDFGQLVSEYDDYSDGFADKIASHMMVSGPFNINSTSVEAWKVLFSSLRGKEVSYLEHNKDRLTVDEEENDLVPVAQGMLPNGKLIQSSELSSDPNVPAEQWTHARGLTEEEIEQLAIAMVEQVKLRGPFLSLSEFVNRRLDGADPDMSKMGALQAAIDDPSVSINAAFRQPGPGSDSSHPRMLDAEAAAVISDQAAIPALNLDTDLSNPVDVAFPEALDGPIAYGSTPYVDQADILRQLAGVLTPRGDTFVIRAYGDSVDAAGNIEARAWCEAVIQRTPEYLDPADENHTKQADLRSVANLRAGRKLEIVRFRWLNANEI